MSRVRQFLLRQYRRWKAALTQIRDTPHAIAGGVAIGVMFGFTPLYGFKTVLAVLVAWLFSCSKLSAVLAVAAHDIFFPLAPLILRWQFQIGFFLVNHPHRWPPKLSPKHFHFENYLSLKTFHVLWPTFVGSLVIGTPIAVVSYFAALEIVSRAQAARARHAAHHPKASHEK
jgi:hypothetical protein